MLGVFSKIFGTRNDREIKKYQQRVEKINQLKETYASLDDEGLKEAMEKIRDSVNQRVEKGESEVSVLDQVLSDVFAITREASTRVLKMTHYDVQLIGGMVIHEGKTSEMRTGEGKTLVATLPVILNALTRKGVHVVTVNDYLAKRDAEEMSKLYEFLGFSTGVVTANMYEENKRKAYAADITYGTNNEFGFDYLRDNMSYSLEEKTQRSHHFAIVDEVDSILIDEARTPLIISGPTNRSLEEYVRADEVAKKLQSETDFTLDEKNKTVIITEEGIKRAEEFFEVENLYTPENALLAHHLDQALKANYLFIIDVDYIVRKGEVLIIDEFTGRVSEGRRFSDGLHQALEAKEKVDVKEESQTLADITFQNYFRLYKKLSGMTGTAQTEATEFSEIYALDVVSIPTNRDIARADHNDLVYKTEEEKFEAVVEKVKELHKKGQPVLIGTASIEKSEIAHKYLKEAKLPHTVLNAKNHQKEAEIILKAGEKGAVTIATNMAGRGVDIKLGEGVYDLGGLAIIGTERHENRRIDNQLRGRSGRQGDPGMSQFYLSLEDNLLRVFGSDKIRNIMDKLGIERGEHIESKIVTRAIENAQKKVEVMHFESRKHVLKYDDVANEQRKVIYKFRDELLDTTRSLSERIDNTRSEYVEYVLNVSEIYSDTLEDEFNLLKVSEIIKEETTYDVAEYQLKNKKYDELVEYLTALLKEFYEDKISKVSDDQRKEIESNVYLQVLDEAWRDHLYQMDILKTGIGLRGYNQKDPLVEFKKESFKLFNELIERIKFEYIKLLHTLQLRNEVEEQENEMFDELQKAVEEFNKLDSAEQKAPTNGKKPKRNDPCPCGSGQKYKQCCGKSGPKKGSLAGA